MSGIEKLQALNRHLTSLLDDPHPGLATWRIALSKTLMELADYAGHGNVSTFPEVLNALRKLVQAHDCENPIAGLFAEIPAALEAARPVLAKAEGR